VKIPRISPPPGNPQAVFIGIFGKKTDGIGIAKKFLENGVDSACD
jgi:hypothetical protein